MSIPPREQFSDLSARSGTYTVRVVSGEVTRGILSPLLILDAIAIVAASVLGEWRYHDPRWFMAEKAPLTWLSFLQLFGIGILALVICTVRLRQSSGVPVWRAPWCFWGLLAAGFIFLAFDEIKKIHEKVDRTLHDFFRLQETGLTDRLDSILVGCYGLVGLSILYVFRKEVWLYRAAFPLFCLGVLLFGFMVAVDLLTDRDDVSRYIVGDPVLSFKLKQWGGALEDSIKILAEWVFLRVAAACFMIAKGGVSHEIWSDV
jgi:hypothetical protein